MKAKRYRVEAQAQGSTTWEAIYYTNSLPVARRCAVGMRKAHNIQVVDQTTERVVSYDLI